MIFLPAIDLKEGRCVRLLRGEMDTAVIFSDDPGAQAELFAKAGCSWLHVVDLDGAFTGRPINTPAVEAVLAAGGLRVQLGGGIRTIATIEHWLDRGVDRVILGTAAVRDPNLARQAFRAFPGRVAVAIDARDGLVAVEGWTERVNTTAAQLAERFEQDEPAAFIYTDIGRDGAMHGPNIEGTLALARTVKTPVILSGGISSMADLIAVKNGSDGCIAGVIAGRAVYEGRVDPKAAVAVLSGRG
jgi:phosphoribosylformimino-5-aminoimidazole carboxamide ribotide isomerase